MSRRYELQNILEELLGSRNVYFQPPANVVMKYPCIRYSRASGDTKFADDDPYAINKRYQIVVIDPNPDSIIADKVERLRMCSFDRHYTADNLNHYIYNLYY